jgi:hypothetical protein
MIWTNAQLVGWTEDAIQAIGTDVNCIWARECIATTAGVSVVSLPIYVRTLRRVTWRGKTLSPVSWEELQLLNPATVFLEPGNANNVEGSSSRPQFYGMYPTNPYDIRLYPTPNESFLTSGEPDPYSPVPNSPSCIIEYWRTPDATEVEPTVSLPSYIMRRTVKAYVLWRAFAAEGKGQDFQASDYYQKKYQFLINQFRAINEGCFVSKRYSLGDDLSELNWRQPRPSLGPNFERTIF